MCNQFIPSLDLRSAPLLKRWFGIAASGHSAVRQSGSLSTIGNLPTASRIVGLALPKTTCICFGSLPMASRSRSLYYSNFVNFSDRKYSNFQSKVWFSHVFFSSSIKLHICIKHNIQRCARSCNLNVWFLLMLWVKLWKKLKARTFFFRPRMLKLDIRLFDDIIGAILEAEFLIL